MNKILILVLCITIGYVSCKNSTKNNKIEIIKQYYNILDNSDYSEITACLLDSLMIKEGEYEQTYSREEYLEFLKWDAVFDPSYEILEIEQQGEIVKTKVSKMDKRIFFLHEEPIITNNVIRFQKNKIISVEIDYVNFNNTTFGRNKNEFLSWIDKNHPELSGFIQDQTKTGGLKYLKAIELYKNRK